MAVGWEQTIHHRHAAWSLALAITLGSSAAGAQIRIDVDTAADRGAVNREVFGADLEFISNNSPEVRRVAETYTTWRFPGGDADSVFRWDRPLTMKCSRMGVDWATAAEWASASGASMLLETNILLTTPESAAMWVSDAMRRGVRVSWVGIGNEVWGDWDRGFRTPTRYAADVRAHATAIRAVAPSARIVLSIGTHNEDTWNRAAIRMTADVIDAVDYHYYPNHHESSRVRNEEVVAGAEGIGPLLTRLRAMIRAEAPARADRIGIVIGEWDGAADPPSNSDDLESGHAYAQWSMANAIFHGAALGEMLVGGVSAAMMYEVQGYRFGNAPGNWCRDAPSALRRPKYLVDKLWRDTLGDRIVGVTTAAVPSYRVSGPTDWDGYAGEVPYVRAYATTGDGGATLRLVVVNRGSAAQVPTVSVSLRGFDPDPRATMSFVGGGALTDTNENVGGPEDAVRTQTRDVSVTGASFTLTPPPYSVSVVVLRRRGAVIPDGGVTDVPMSTDASGGDGSVGTDGATGMDATAPQDARSGDAAPSLDAAAGADATRTGTNVATVAGCGCVVHGRTHGAPGAWMVALAGAAGVRRRRFARGSRLRSSGAAPTA